MNLESTDTMVASCSRRQFVTASALAAVGLSLGLTPRTHAECPDAPTPPPGYALVVDSAGNCVVDAAGNFLIGKDA